MPAQERKEPRLLTGPGGHDLATARLELVGRLPYSSNGTFLVRGTGSSGAFAAVYKPAAGERPLWDFPPDTLYRREAATYELSRWLGWGLVPLTVVRDDAPLGPGSVQAYVEHDPEEHYFTLLESHRTVFRRLAFFDMLCNNADRKAGHCLLSGRRVVGIDHGLTFHVEPKLRTVIWDFAGERLPARERLAAASLAAELAQGASPLLQKLHALLAPPEVAGLRERAAELSEEGRFPHPHSNWAFPWPLV